MAGLKHSFKPQHLYQTSAAEQNLRDKQTIETLKQRLNQLLNSDPQAARKAALILSQWLAEKPKK